MADAAEFVVSMIDKVTGPAKKIAAALGVVRQKFLDSADAAEKMRRAQGATWRIMSDFRRGFGAKNPFDGKDASHFGEKTREGIKSASSAVFGMGKMALLGLSAVGAAAGGLLVKSTIEAANFAETTMMAFHSLTGSQDGANKAWEVSLRLARQLGQGVEETAGAMKHLLAMQFSLGEAEEMVKISADLKSVTGDAMAAERALTAITQIKAKGKLQSEELVGQLAEAGVSTTLVYQELSKLYGKDLNTVRKMLGQGQIDADTGIKAIKQAILRKTHSTEAGTAGTSYAQETFSGLLGQLKNAPQFLFQRLAEQIRANLDKFRPLVIKVIEAIDNIKGDQMSRFIGNVLQFAERLIPLAIAFAEGFADGFESINDAMGAMDPSVAQLDTARSIGKGIAKIFEWIFDIVSKITKAIGWLDEHDFLAPVLVTALSLLAVMRTIVAVSSTAAAIKGFGTMLGIGGGTAAAAGAGTAATAATTAAASTAGTVAATGAGTSGAAALLAGVGGATGVAAIGAAAAGVGAAAAGYIWREEIANWMLDIWGNKDAAAERGLGGSPTDTMQGLQKVVANAGPKTNNVTLHTTVNVDGEGKDGAQVGKDIGQHQRESLEQFFQSHALEQGAM